MNSVSLDPPLILFSLDRRTYRRRAFLSTQSFAVNVLREGQDEPSERLARALADGWSGASYATWDTGCPILTGTCASPRPSVTPKKKRKAETAEFMEVAEAPFDLMCS